MTDFNRCIWTGARLWLSQWGCLCSVDLFEVSIPLEHSRNEALLGRGYVWVFHGIDRYQYPQCTEEDEGDILAAIRRLYSEATHEVDNVEQGLRISDVLVISPTDVNVLKERHF